MYKPQSFNGADLPAKTLCLTFDDGPGIYTSDIARFLFENNIQATFFVVGKYAYQHPEVLLQLKEMKHLIGNHTYEHPDLPYYVSANGNVLDQVLRTDVLIKPYVDADRIYFRAPYGKWSAEVAKELNQNILTINHIGPIHWEIAGVDCYYWRNNWSVEAAVERYLNDIEAQGKGIIVMHDDIADMDIVKPKNQTLDLLKVLIPKLLGLGYQFVRLDEIESIKTASTVKLNFTLQSKNGKYICLNNANLEVTGKPGHVGNMLQLEDLGYGKIAIKTANDMYLTCTDAENSKLIAASKNTIDETTTFDLIPVDDNGIMLRCYNGNYLAVNKTKLTFKAEYMRQAAIFKYANHNLPTVNSISLIQKISLFEKKLKFIKSKFEQKFLNQI